MKFCSKCDNMLYLDINESNPNLLAHFCRKCGTKEDIKKGNTKDYCIYKAHVQQSAKFENFVNKYTKHDPTLPTIKNMKCPNVNCKSHASQSDNDDNILYIRFDDENMKYLYICKTCDHTWSTSS